MFENWPILNDMIAPVFNHLGTVDGEFEFELIPALPVHQDQINAFETEFSLSLPAEFRNIYLETDGFEFFVHGGKLEGSIYVPDLHELRLLRQRWLDGDMPDRSQTQHLSDEEARETFAQMWYWLPFNEIGNGDRICLDCSSGQVVLADHEFGSMGDDGRNGLIFAENFRDFLRHRADACFQGIDGYLFDEELRNGERWADWSSGRFLPDYCLK